MKPNRVANKPTAKPSTSRGASRYTLDVRIIDGPMTETFAKQHPAVSRTIQMRGDQTLQALHRAIFKAFDREEEHLHEFNFGKGPYDREGPRYTVAMNQANLFDDEPKAGNVSKTTVDSLNLEVGRVFGYWFDFGDDWRHEIRVEAIEDAPPTGRFPKVTAHVGESPPQYANPEELE